jgi:citrate synthase
MFTPLFAVARTTGWIAHWIEMLSDTDAKLVRPRQLYVGETERGFVDIDARTERQAAVG